MSTHAIGVAIDPNIGLGSRYRMARNRPITSQEKNDSASKAVARGKNPEKIARCKIESAWMTNPATAHQNAKVARLPEDASKNRRYPMAEARYKTIASLKKRRSTCPSLPKSVLRRFFQGLIWIHMFGQDVPENCERPISVIVAKSGENV